MERAAVQPTQHWAITDYFQRTSENILILRRVLRPFVTFMIYLCHLQIYLLTYLLTYLVSVVLGVCRASDGRQFGGMR